MELAKRVTKKNTTRRMTALDVLRIFNPLWFAIAAVLRRLNRGYDDTDLRDRMDELTPDELKRKLADEAYQNYVHEDSTRFWTMDK